MRESKGDKFKNSQTKDEEEGKREGTFRREEEEKEDDDIQKTEAGEGGRNEGIREYS